MKVKMSVVKVMSPDRFHLIYVSSSHFSTPITFRIIGKINNLHHIKVVFHGISNSYHVNKSFFLLFF